MDVPNIAFLGICEDLRLIPATPQTLPELSIIGLKNVIASHLFPLSLNESFFVFSIYSAKNFQPTQIALKNSKGHDVFSITISLDEFSPTQGDSTHELIEGFPNQIQESIYPPVPKYLWSPSGTQDICWTTVPLRPGHSLPPLLVYEPGLYILVGRRDDIEFPLGYLMFVLASSPPLTPDRIAAIKAKPHAAKLVHIELRCRECGDAVKAYAGLERDSKIESDGWTWYNDLPDSFSCACGSTCNIDLSYIRSNLHSLLGDSLRTGPRVSLTHMYDPSSIETIYNRFKALLDKDTVEEEIQQFIEENPVILQSFSPNRVFYKKSILSKFQTDIAIVNPKNELVLIELEKASTRLLLKSGGMASQLTHAFDQVRDWLHEIDEHRSAIFEAFNLSTSDISQIVGAVICGRDFPYDPDTLRKLKATRFDRIAFFTYDDLLRSLGVLIRSLLELESPNPW